MNETPETVISGSFRKHMEKIGELTQHFESSGIHVRAPKSSKTDNPDEEFIILVGDDPNQPPVELEKDYMRDIAKATFLYVADLGGYVGKSAATEMAYARLKGIPIISAEKITTFSNDIPENVRVILAEAINTILPKDQVTLVNINELRKRIASETPQELSSEQRETLVKTIKSLFKDLRSLEL